MAVQVVVLVVILLTATLTDKMSAIFFIIYLAVQLVGLIFYLRDSSKIWEGRMFVGNF